MMLLSILYLHIRGQRLMQTKSNFGLLDEDGNIDNSSDRWIHFTKRISNLNAKASNSESYKGLFQNDDCWDKCYFLQDTEKDTIILPKRITALQLGIAFGHYNMEIQPQHGYSISLEISQTRVRTHFSPQTGYTKRLTRTLLGNSNYNPRHHYHKSFYRLPSHAQPLLLTWLSQI